MTDEEFDCDRLGCGAKASNALKFSQHADAHTHACKPCTGYAYEYMKVTESHPLPCPWVHVGDPWRSDIPHLET